MQLNVAMDELLAKQKNDVKELLGKTQAMKHSIPKGDKKKKKQIMSEIALLEAELKNKHETEMENFHKQEIAQASVGRLCEKIDATDLEERSCGKQKKSKSQRRKERKLEEDKEREKRIAQAEIDNRNSLRNTEAEQLTSMLFKRRLTIKEIAADGNCLYNAIADQLSNYGHNLGWKELRSITANQMRDNKEEYLPFMLNPSTGELYTPDQFYKYCEDVEGTSAWGGHLEIQALSKALKMQIEIFQANAPILKIGEEFNAEPLRISYHLHAYGLGEHYNSVLTQTVEIKEEN